MLLYVEIILLAMVAGFLAMRLYSVLGKRTGHEQPIAKPAEERVGAAPAPRAVADVPLETTSLADSVIEPAARAGIKQIIAIEPAFDVGRFVDGAGSAYRMILEAYWKGEEQDLAWLASDDVRKSFAGAIAERKAAGHILDNRLVAIERATISDAIVEGRQARLTVRFEADIAAVTRDAEGVVIAGSMTDAVQTHDVWTFARTLRSDDPNWILIDTDEAA